VSDVTGRGEGAERPLESGELPARLTQSGYPEGVSLLGLHEGPGGRDGYRRLYLSTDLSQYCEVPEDKVLGSSRLPSGRIGLWVRRDTSVDFYSVTSRSVEFLEGEMQRRFQPRTTGFASFVARTAQRAARQTDGTVCICPVPRTPQFPGDSCGLCPGTFSDCPGGGGGGGCTANTLPV
jgi:hypothetical protein